MLKLYLNNKIVKLNWVNSSLIYNFLKLNFFSISITVTGRIFRWLKGKYFMKFILPVSNKPALFFKNAYTVIPNPNSEFSNFIWFSKESFLTIKHLFFKIKKPSIFNKRGFHILNKIIYKKRGKVTSYITNK